MGRLKHLNSAARTQQKTKTTQQKRLEWFLLEVDRVPPLQVELAERHSKAFWRAETSRGNRDDRLASSTFVSCQNGCTHGKFTCSCTVREQSS